MITFLEISNGSHCSNDASHFKYTQTDRTISMVALVVIAGAALAFISIAAMATFEAAVITAVIAIPVAIILLLTANKGHHYFISRRDGRGSYQQNRQIPSTSGGLGSSGIRSGNNRKPQNGHIPYMSGTSSQVPYNQQQLNQQPNRQTKSNHIQFPGGNNTQRSNNQWQQTDRKPKSGHTIYSTRDSSEQSGTGGQNREGNRTNSGNPRRKY